MTTILVENCSHVTLINRNKYIVVFVVKCVLSYRNSFFWGRDAASQGKWVFCVPKERVVFIFKCSKTRKE